MSALGLNNLPTGRRDSFDRNNSPFSVDYRTKWNLGTNSNSLTESQTPPLSIAPLQLGDIINSRMNSTAPGSEARFRNNVSALATNTIFGSSNSLFSKLNTSHSNISTTGSSPEKSDRSRLLDEFRNNRFVSILLIFLKIFFRYFYTNNFLSIKKISESSAERYSQSCSGIFTRPAWL